MMRSGDHKQHVHDNCGKETASSSDVTDTNEDTKDTDEDESNHSIARSFDEPSAENLMTDCSIVNDTTELNYEDDIKTSVNVKEVGYFNIFECGRNLLDKIDVTYQRAFAASEKTSREAHIAYRNRVKQ